MTHSFHYAFKVKDLASTREFYINILGCKPGRASETWLDFDFFGHQLSAHVSAKLPEADFCGLVDGIKVPIPHFGCILNQEDFEKVIAQLKQHQTVFLIEPQVRYPNQVGEQQTAFFFDFSGNPIELKCFKNPQAVFQPNA
ncbi:VOC family protein [Aliikangiella sp. IMCC44632]